MIRATPDPGTARVKFSYSLYKIFKSEVRVLYYKRAWDAYWCYNIIPLVKSGITYRAYANRDNYKLVIDTQLYMYVPDYFLELFEDLEVI